VFHKNAKLKKQARFIYIKKIQLLIEFLGLLTIAR
jgi:hypothetical protein